MRSRVASYKVHKKGTLILGNIIILYILTILNLTDDKIIKKYKQTQIFI